MSTQEEKAKAHREARWEDLCNETWTPSGKKKPELTGNALGAREVRKVPLEAKAILDLVVGNLSYFGDSYYRVITDPVELKIEEFYESIGENRPDS